MRGFVILITILFLSISVFIGYNFTPRNMESIEDAGLTWHRITEAFKHAYSLRTQLGDYDIGSQSFRDYVAEVCCLNPSSADLEGV